MRPRALSFVIALALLACDGRRDAAWVDARIAEAHERNEAAVLAHGQEDERRDWTLTLVGPDGSTEVLRFAQLEQLRHAEVRTMESAESRSSDVLDFRGIRFSELARRVPGGDASPEVTILASDGFRATVAMADVQRYPIMLATDVGGAPLGRDHGGPLYSVFPVTDHPELSARYTSSSWVFYVTHLVIGTAPPVLRVGSRTLDEASLEQLPIARVTATVGYRVGWPSEPVQLRGVRLRDVLAATGTELAPGARVRVLSRAPITRSEERPTYVSASDVLEHDVILALRYGDEDLPIPSRLGGPIALAFPEEVVGRVSEHDWLTFVDELVVEQAGAPHE